MFATMFIIVVVKRKDSLLACSPQSLAAYDDVLVVDRRILRCIIRAAAVSAAGAEPIHTELHTLVDSKAGNQKQIIHTHTLAQLNNECEDNVHALLS